MQRRFIFLGLLLFSIISALAFRQGQAGESEAQTQTADLTTQKTPTNSHIYYFPILYKPQLEITLEPFITQRGIRHPIAITHAGDSRLFVATRLGEIHVYDQFGNYIDQVMDQSAVMDVSSHQEEGLLGVAFHPNFANNGYVFVSYTDDDIQSSVIARYYIPPGQNEVDYNSEIRLLQVEQPEEGHNGGDIHFGPDGNLYIALGDGTTSNNPDLYNNSQHGRRLLGKMLRINVDGQGITPMPCVDNARVDDDVLIQNYTVPTDNPFVGNSSMCDEIWSLGLRNPWKFSFDRANGDMYIADVGMWLYEEVNYEPAGWGGGANYGWRCLEANANTPYSSPF